MNQDDLPVDVVMARRFELAEQIALIEGRHKNELEEPKAEMALCEKFIQQYMTTHNMQQFKTADGHQTFFTTGDSVTVADPEAFFSYVFQNNARHLLNNAANKTAVKEFLEQNNGVTPPGIKYDSFRKLSWRKGHG